MISSYGLAALEVDWPELEFLVAGARQCAGC